uniref:Uncharacterized protein n=1 Tax=Anguilla anguilla TaxID=7936 RepID=A0A0E9SSF3_ANGAN
MLGISEQPGTGSSTGTQSPAWASTPGRWRWRISIRWMKETTIKRALEPWLKQVHPLPPGYLPPILGHAPFLHQQQIKMA